jgi:uncharacterized protein YbjT (DUF2867 family)
MDNYNWSREAIQNNGVFFGFGLRPDKTLQLIAADDIGAFAALVFDQPETYIGQAIELAGDEMTEPQIAATFTRVLGRPIQVGQMPMDPNQPTDPENIKMGMWFNAKGYEADIAALRNLHPGLMTLDTWIRKTGWV